MAALRPSSIGRQGFSLVEVLIALSVMAVGILALMSSIGALHSSRNTAADANRVHALVQTISERLASLPWDTLGNRDNPTAPWSQSRSAGMAISLVNSHTSYNRPPLTENAVLDEDNLLKQGLLSQPARVRNLRVYIEYYRALQISAAPAPTAPILAGPGLMDGSAAGLPRYTTPQGMNTAIRSAAIRTATRLSSNNPTTIIRTNDPIAIRVVAFWDDDGVFTDANGDGIDDDALRFELITARKR